MNQQWMARGILAIQKPKFNFSVFRAVSEPGAKFASKMKKAGCLPFLIAQ